MANKNITMKQNVGTPSAPVYDTLYPATIASQVAGLIDPRALMNTGWKKIQSYNKSGAYTWIAPDLFNGKPYNVGVTVIGGGGSGCAGVQLDTQYPLYANGGASAYAKSFKYKVTPNQSYNIVIAKGGEPAFPPYTPTSESVTKGKTGGTSSFSGISALGGEGGKSGKSKSGSLNEYSKGGMMTGGYEDNGVEYGGALFYYITGTGRVPDVFPVDFLSCFNPFENVPMLGVGGKANSRGQFSIGGKNPFTGEGGGAGGFNESGKNATEAGCGGGGSIYDTSAVPISGAGADGAVYIYVQGVE